MILGIDLGTTNSCGCYVKNGEPVVVKDGNTGALMFPSCVRFRSNKSFVCHTATKNLNSHKDYVVVRSKRVIGRKYNDPEVQSMKNSCGSPIIEKDGYPYFQISATGNLQSPTDIGTKIVQHIINAANEKSDSKVTRVCITVPAHFDENQRSATQQCVLNCGFTADQVEILNEPTAAAITYVNDSEFRDGYLLVYDLGGGTFDVSIVEVRNKECTVKSYAGNNALGGADFDEAVAQIILRKFRQSNGFDLLPNPKDPAYQNAYRRLLQAAEATKIALSTDSSSPVDLSSFGGLGRDDDDDDDDSDDDDDNELEVTRDELNDAIRSKILATMKTIDEALSKAGLEKRDISKVIRRF